MGAHTSSNGLSKQEEILLICSTRLTYTSEHVSYAPHMNYEAQNFSGLFRASFGPSLWQYLRRPETLLAMEIATKLRKPAVEAIGDDLIRDFGTVVQQKR